MNIIVTGGNFSNKGAETMLLITMSKLREKYPEAKLFYTTFEKYNSKIEKEYDFHYIYKFQFLRVLCRNPFPKNLYYRGVDSARLASRKNWNQLFQSDKRVKEIIEDTKLIVDVSGFSLSSKFKTAKYIGTEYYLDMIEGASKRNIEVVLLPQSFGPFDYGKYSERKLQRIKNVLPKASLIFAREKSGYELLANLIGYDNLEHSDDLVFQTNVIDFENVVKEKLDLRSIKPNTANNNVGIVPNARVMERFENKEEFISFYVNVVSILSEQGKNVYLIWHSKEDKNICIEVNKALNNSLHMVEQELEFYEYEQFIEGFDFIIASRFHSIVHAYRHSVPCVCLGWADKYKNLLGSCDQSAYLIDVSEDKDNESIKSMILQMCNNYENESRIIENMVKEIQKKNCFEIMFNKVIL